MFMLGRRADYDPRRRLLAIYDMRIRDIISFMCDESTMYKGAMLVTHRWDKEPLLIRAGRVSHRTSLKELMNRAAVFAFDRYVNSDFTFVPWNGEDCPRTSSHRKLLEWAREHGLPWVCLLDNQYATFSDFESKLERRLFARFLNQSILNLHSDDLRIPWPAWLKIRKGLYAHGWTMNRCECFWADGKTRFDLWGGTLKGSLVRPVALLSEVNKRLTLQFDGGGACQVSIQSRKCPLDDVNGEP